MYIGKNKLRWLFTDEVSTGKEIKHGKQKRIKD